MDFKILHHKNIKNSKISIKSKVYFIDAKGNMEVPVNVAEYLFNIAPDEWEITGSVKKKIDKQEVDIKLKDEKIAYLEEKIKNSEKKYVELLLAKDKKIDAMEKEIAGLKKELEKASKKKESGKIKVKKGGRK